MNKQIVIIPVHNQLPYLQKCIVSVRKNSFDAIIIVIDDGSDEETAKWISVHTGESIWVSLRNEKAQGFSNACNKGIQYALDNFDFTCLCLLNSDAEVVTPNWFDKVEYCFEAGDKIGVASVVSNNAMAQTIHNITKYLSKIESKPTVYCNIVHGFCYFISKELIEEIGLLDEKNFPHYGSEDCYSLMSIKAGFHNLIVGSVFVNHNNETSYTHDVRARYVKKSLPNLLNMWGRRYVNDCVVQANACGKYLNNY